MFNPLNSLVCSCITPYSDLIRLALYFKKICLFALSGSNCARRLVMTPPAVLKRCSEGTIEAGACQKRPSTIRLTYPVPGTILAGTGAGTGLENIAGYLANWNWISGTSLLKMKIQHNCLHFNNINISKELQSSTYFPVRAVGWVSLDHESARYLVGYIINTLQCILLSYTEL